MGAREDHGENSSAVCASDEVADNAEAINGKLYVMGGGFDTMAVAAFPADIHFWFATILLVPWKDTNRRLPIAGSVETMDGDDLGWKLEGELESGRAPGRRGGETTIALAGPVGFHADEPMTVVVKLNFAGDQRSVPLTLVPPPGAQVPPQRGPDAA
jgi:hypothetical protein